MKYIFSISFILIYLLGSFQSSWIFADFYWNQEDYTEKYCQMLDEGITQCRASCYLDILLEEQQKEPAEAHINTHQKVKVVEITSDEGISLATYSGTQKCIFGYLSDHYYSDYQYSIFHPPKS